MVNLPRQRAWFSWGAVAVLAASCCVLGVMQFRAIGQLAAAERARLYETLQQKGDEASRALGQQIADACLALRPTGAEVNAAGREQAYATRYQNWRKSNGELFRHVALAVPAEDSIQMLDLDFATGHFAPGAWPSNWEPTRGRGGPGRGSVLEFPRFGEQPGEREQEWLLVELNPDYIRSALLPRIVDRYLGPDYEASLVNARDLQRTDVSVPLTIDGGRPGGRFGGRGFGDGRRGPERRPPPPNDMGGWRLLVRSRAGSLEALVSQSQRRNIALSALLFGLILATLSALIVFSGQTQRLADLQINFVAGVSHELRTPLTVIRTAAYNLRGQRIRSQPDQVERYGRLIESESEKLERLVEDVLRFASAKAGQPIRKREPVGMNDVLERVLAASRTAIEGTGVAIEEHVAARLPVVLGDALALRHALQNVIDNAVKYGAEGANWVGVRAEVAGAVVQIRVTDRGPGIPGDEIPHIFDSFFRGRRAVRDQVHGTGLGLNLAKTIIEAHDGSIAVKSTEGQGTEFTIRIPVAAAEYQDEFANSAD